MKIFLYIFAPYFLGCLGLVMLTSLPTAIAFGAIIAAVTWLAVRFNDKHTHLEFDDKLPEERRKTALEIYVQEVKKTKCGNLDSQG